MVHTPFESYKTDFSSFKWNILEEYHYIVFVIWNDFTYPFWMGVVATMSAYWTRDNVQHIERHYSGRWFVLRSMSNTVSRDQLDVLLLLYTQMRAINGKINFSVPINLLMRQLYFFSPWNSSLQISAISQVQEANWFFFRATLVHR